MNGTFPCLAPMHLSRRGPRYCSILLCSICFSLGNLKTKFKAPEIVQTLQTQNPASVPPNTYFNALPEKKKEKRTDISYKCSSRKGINFHAIYAQWEKLPFYFLCTHASKQATVSSTCILKTQQHLLSTVFLSTFCVCAKPKHTMKNETDSTQMYMNTWLLVKCRSTYFKV